MNQVGRRVQFGTDTERPKEKTSLRSSGKQHILVCACNSEWYCIATATRYEPAWTPHGTARGSSLCLIHCLDNGGSVLDVMWPSPSFDPEAATVVGHVSAA